MKVKLILNYYGSGNGIAMTANKHPKRRFMLDERDSFLASTQ
jgi:hypothetical protein